ncbi:ferritin-like domain-containing protein [Streptantibioticus ferralitis]|uniref:Ferritin-like protein n=1 Tax=Streptantibioticus ferralitis TaxID=236510 RepID=A0ABT5YUB8_9ACTN|nr:ferritin-like protein [Streptantibioticus ferralitis]MDF2255024.1 ferritin-like protein [Streptantibioticus ferralitis]
MASPTTTEISLPPIVLSSPVDPTTEISDVSQLINHLKQAAYLEMSTIPMYLYASFSIGSRGYSQWDPGMGAFRLIRSIVVEEMLHLCLVRNLLVALGSDEIAFYSKDFMPKYPSPMLHRHPELILHLGPCDKKLVRDVFMEFERPKPRKGEGPPPPGQYATIGEFYKAVGKGLAALDKKMGPALWRHNRPELQYVAAYWNKDGGGAPVLVHNLKTAKDALKIIVEQGEGIDPDKPSVPIDPLKPIPGLDELPHYTKFKRIADGVEPLGPVWALPTDPCAKMYDGDAAVKAVNTLFNAMYCYVLHMLDVMYHTPWKDVEPGKHSKRYGLERTFMSAMQGVLVTVADMMVATRTTVGDLAVQYNAAPTFEYHKLPKTGKRKHLIELCDKAMTYFPQLGGDNSVRWLLGKMPDL